MFKLSSYVKTAELKKLIPTHLTCRELEGLTGLSAKMLWKVKAGGSEFTDYYKADQICVGLDKIADFYLLEEYSDPPKVINGKPTKSRKREQKHGIASYNNRGCRCQTCKSAKQTHDYRRDKDKRRDTNRRYRAKLKANANSN